MPVNHFTVEAGEYLTGRGSGDMIIYDGDNIGRKKGKKKNFNLQNAFGIQLLLCISAAAIY